MKSYLYNTVLNQENMHNELIKEREIIYNDEEMTSSKHVYKIMTEAFELHKKAEEYVYMIALDTKMRPLGFFEISHGTVNCTMVSPREIYIRAILTGASNIIICHNHPSGDPTPSTEDVKITKRIKSAGEILGIKLIDHIIIGRTYISVGETGLI